MLTSQLRSSHHVTGVTLTDELGVGHVILPTRQAML